MNNNHNTWYKSFKRSLSPTFLAVLMMLASFTQFARAESHTFGDYELHYVAFNSQFLRPDVAKSYGIERSSRLGLVNISILKNGKPVKGDVAIESANLLSQRRNLKPWLVDEGDGMYYLATFEHTDGELLHFSVQVTPEKSSLSQTIKFSQKFYEN